MAYSAAAASDDSSILALIENTLSESGFNIISMSSGGELLKHAEKYKTDIIFLDLNISDMDGFEVVNRLSMSINASGIPVMIISDSDDADLESMAFDEGAIDFIVKPFSEQVFLRRVPKISELIGNQSDLEKKVSRMNAEILSEHQKNERLSMQIVKTLAGTIDAKDSFTNGHSLRVAEYSREIARRAGYNEKRQNEIYMIGLLHDVGKIGVPDSVINKPSRLTDEEFAIIKQHPVLGYEILKNITEMPKLAAGARWHHERYDGKGYPDGLMGTNIPEEARVIAVADAYDAMSSKRSFHNINEQDYVLAEFQRGKGVQFDPIFADIMITMMEEDKEYRMKEQAVERAKSSSVEIANDDEEVRQKGAALLRMLEACGINTETGMKYCMNDINSYTEILKEFTADAESRIDFLKKSFASKNWKQYSVSLRSLKGTAKALGAKEISDAAALLEASVKAENYDLVRTMHGDLIEQYSMIAENILAVTIYFT